jgi:hypothetical protein
MGKTHPERDSVNSSEDLPTDLLVFTSDVLLIASFRETHTLRDTIFVVKDGSHLLPVLYFRKKGSPVPVLNLEQTKVNGMRIPCNVVFIHSPRCTSESCIETCPVLHLNQQSGFLRPSGKVIQRKEEESGKTKTFKFKEKGTVWVRHDDGGTAERFFPVFWSFQEFMGWLRVLYSTVDLLNEDPSSLSDG